MRETMKVWKVFLVWNYDKEEAWLNEMAAQGWTLTAVGFCNYTFVKTEPGAYNIRMEMRPHDDGYLELLREDGVEYVGRVIQWHYYRKPVELGAFDLYSDIDSRVAHLDRIGKMLFWSLLQLLGAMSERAFAQQIDALASNLVNPVE